MLDLYEDDNICLKLGLLNVLALKSCLKIYGRRKTFAIIDELDVTQTVAKKW